MKKIALIAVPLLLLPGVLLSTLMGEDQKPAAPSNNGRAAQLPGNAQNGWKIFFTKNCVKCHAIVNEGGTIGPDLGRSVTTLTAGQLAGEMWNHIPRMRQKMEEEGIPFTELTQGEMADVFAFLYFLRYLDAPGSPSVGKSVLESKGCVNCHSIKDEEGKIAPALGKWGKFANPIVWTQVMWDHALKMKEKLQEAGMQWPQFSATEMSGLIAYISSVSSSDEKVYLLPGDPMRGKTTFSDKKCVQCHSVGGEGGKIGPDLAPATASARAPANYVEMASTMWNHLPAMLRTMKEQGIEVSTPTAQEMADIIAYLFAAQYADRPGDPQKGEKIFREKQCISCHTKNGSGGTIGPGLSTLKGKVSPIQMAASRWKSVHGTTMYDQIMRMNIPWPQFEGNEMIDLMEYLNR